MTENEKESKAGLVTGDRIIAYIFPLIFTYECWYVCATSSIQ